MDFNLEFFEASQMFHSRFLLPYFLEGQHAARSFLALALDMAPIAIKKIEVQNSVKRETTPLGRNARHGWQSEHSSNYNTILWMR